MHIPDGFLDPKVSAGMMGAAAMVLGYAMAKVKAAVTMLLPARALALAGRGMGNIAQGSRRVLTKAGEQKIYQMGMVASLVFAAQMFNFPISQGTSGHFLGGALAVILLGPFAGTVVMAVVLLVQALFFADGGIFALGANIINMSFFGAWVIYYIYAVSKKVVPEWMATMLSAWLSVVLAALACAVEIGLSNTIAVLAVVSAMLKVHVLIGVAEALITVAMVKIFREMMPEQKQAK